MITPEEFLDSVTDEKTFLQFIKLLSDDWYKSDSIEDRRPSAPYVPRALGWENGTIGDFLEAASAYGEDTHKQKNSDLKNPWRRAAEIIFAGKIYE